MQYACYIVFEVILKIPFVLNVLPESLDIKEQKPILYYGNHKPDWLDNCVFIKSSGLIFRSDIVPQLVSVKWENGIPLLFTNHGEQDALGFDAFAAVFYMVSRYEEYLPFRTDKFGRYPEALSLSGRYDFTHLPVVHYWAFAIWDKLTALCPNLQRPDLKPTAIFTYDIDVAYAYKGRSPGRHVLSLAKDVLKFDFKNIKHKIKSGLGTNSDPSDTYKEITGHSLPRVFFFLLAKQKSKFDSNLSPSSRALKELIKRIYSQEGVPGIHPSFKSSENNYLIKKEKKSLENIINQSVTKSRQHFLKFKTPDTFRALIDAGIEEDYSMQYPEMPGFRAGICLPYRWFDVEKDKISDLTIFPGCIMETTFRDDLNIAAQLTIDWYLRTWEAVKQVNGCFISIWHNDSLQDFLEEDNPLAFIYLHRLMTNIIEKDTGLK